MNPDAARFILRSKDHQYTFDGVTYPGVTGVLKVLDKSDALMMWASKQTAQAAVSMVDALPTMLENIGPEGVVKALTSRSAWTNEKARDLGTSVHDLADKVATGQSLPAMTPEELTRVDHYERWWRTSGWELRASEYLVVNPDKGYGGTGDLLCRDANGLTVLADIKSGNVEYRGKVYDTIILQLAAYGAAKWLETEAGLFMLPPIDRYAVIHLTADGCREIPVEVTPQDVEAFYACLRLDGWRKSLKGRKAA